MTMITLTEKAADHIKNFIGARSDSVGMELRVEKAGCTGYTLVLNKAYSIEEDHFEFNDKGVTILVLEEDLRFVAGTEIDYVRNGLNSSFVFDNPNATGCCGCGTSFSVS